MANLTLLDLAKRNNSDATIGIVESMIQSNPILTGLPFRSIPGISINYSRRTALPSVGFRAFNEGVATTKSVIEQKTIETKILNARSTIDTALAESDPRGVDAARAEEAAGHLAAMGNKFDYTCFYGVGSTTPREFDGLSTILNSTAVSTYSTLTGASGSIGSIYAIAFTNAVDQTGSIKGVEGLLANGEMPRSRDLGVQLISDGTNDYTAYTTDFEARMGFAIYDTRSVARLAGISTSVTPTAANINAMITSMRPFKPSALIMPAGVYNIVMALKTSLYYSPADTDLFGTVETWAGIPLLIADNLTMTET